MAAHNAPSRGRDVARATQINPKRAARHVITSYPSTAGNPKTTMGKGGEMNTGKGDESGGYENCLLYTSPSPRD